MMFHPQFIQPSWLDYSLMDLQYQNIEAYDLDGLDFDMVPNMGNLDFSSSLTTTDDDSDLLSSIPYFPTMYPEKLPFDSILMPNCSDDAHVILSPVGDYAFDLCKLADMSNDKLFIGDVDDVFGLTEGIWEGDLLPNPSVSEEDSTVSSTKSSDVSFDEITTILQPIKELEDHGQQKDADNEVRILHLLKAYGEAVGSSIGLGQVILQRISKKVSPVGKTMERLGHYLSQGDDDDQNDYLKQESRKNYVKVFQAFYEICPYGRFAHFGANMAILEAIPEDVRTIHIVDFDIGEGVQWPPLLEALGRHRTVRLTSITRREDQVNNPQLQFKVTKKRLIDYAWSLGLRLKVEEMEMEELLAEKRRMKKRGGEKEWMVFNCMVSLPFMKMERSRKHPWEFIRVAKELLNASNSTCSINTTSKRSGIITFGRGGNGSLQTRKGSADQDGDQFGSFFDGCLLHFHALFESMEWHFPPQLSLARTAIESLFVGPYVSSTASLSKWEENHGMGLGVELEGWRVSQENLLEAKEMVRGSESFYEVRIDGVMENEMVLEWKGTPLVRVSVWK